MFLIIDEKIKWNIHKTICIVCFVSHQKAIHKFDIWFKLDLLIASWIGILSKLCYRIVFSKSELQWLKKLVVKMTTFYVQGLAYSTNGYCSYLIKSWIWYQCGVGPFSVESEYFHSVCVNFWLVLKHWCFILQSCISQGTNSNISTIFVIVTFYIL